MFRVLHPQPGFTGVDRHELRFEQGAVLLPDGDLPAGRRAQLLRRGYDITPADPPPPTPPPGARTARTRTRRS